MKKEMVLMIIGVLVIGGIGFFWYTSQTPVVPPTPSPTPANIPPAPPVSPNPGTVPPAPAPTPAPVSVEILNFQYAPKILTVKVGTTVTWTNRDTAPHTVTASAGNAGPDSSLFGQNQTFSYTYNTVGTFEYFCKPHPYMKGSVVVTQ